MCVGGTEGCLKRYVTTRDAAAVVAVSRYGWLLLRLCYLCAQGHVLCRTFTHASCRRRRRRRRRG